MLELMAKMGGFIAAQPILAAYGSGAFAAFFAAIALTPMRHWLACTMASGFLLVCWVTSITIWASQSKVFFAIADTMFAVIITLGLWSYIRQRTYWAISLIGLYWLTIVADIFYLFDAISYHTFADIVNPIFIGQLLAVSSPALFNLVQIFRRRANFNEALS